MSYIDVNGLESASGNRYFLLTCGDQESLIPVERLYLSNNILPKELAKFGIYVSSKKDIEDIIRSASEISAFSQADIAEYPGWNKKQFALPDGTIIGCESGHCHVAFSRNPALGQRGGNLDAWRSQVAGPLAHNPIAAFLLMAGFVPIVSRFMPSMENLTIELIGGPDAGKTLVQKLVTSLVSKPDDLTRLRDVQSDFEQVRWLGRDRPLCVDEVKPALLAATKPQKAALFARTIYELPRGPGGRLTILSGQEPLCDACGIASPDDTTLTINICDSRAGLFESVPGGFSSAADFAESLLVAARANHGHAGPAFVEAIRSYPGAATIKEKLAKSEAEFRATAKRAGLDGVRHRDLQAIAAIYSAGRLARACGILPPRFRCRKAARAVLELCAANRRIAHEPFVARLERLAASGDLLVIDPNADQAEQARKAEAAVGTVTAKASGRLIKLAPENVNRAFSDWARLKRSAEVRAVLRVDGKNLASWGNLAPGTERRRLFQFLLPAAPEPTLLEGTATIADNPGVG